MKKIFNFITLIATVALCGCNKFDDGPLRQRIDEYKERLEAIAEKIEALNSDLSALGYLTGGNVITSVSQDSDGKYVVTYRDNDDVEKTLVLATMDDIVDVPIVGVELYDDGAYYWTKTVDGETTWLTTGEGDEMLPVAGYTPTISVDGEGFWTVDGTRILDSNDNPIEATTDATSVFRSAEVDGEGNFSLTLGDGSVLTLPVFNSLNLILNSVPVTTVAQNSADIVVSYELTGSAKDNAIVALAKVEGVEAVLDRAEKTVTVSFDASFEGGKVIVMAYDPAGGVIVKPLFYRAPTGGVISISSAAQLSAFAAAVNAGGEESVADVVLTQDIDMNGIAWTPIGNGTCTTGNVLAGASFRGTFDGQGHKITNLSIIVPADAPVNSTWGLFGVLDGATVRNVVLGEGSMVVSTAAAFTTVGGIAGTAADSTVEGCENHASFSIGGGADNIREVSGGIVANLAAIDADSYVAGCTNYGLFTSENTSNTRNGATGFQIGGVVGYANNAVASSPFFAHVVDCVNEGDMRVEATRTAGIIATMNQSVKVERCVNNATVSCTDLVASNSRVGGIASAAGGNTFITSCVNNGTVQFAVEGNTTRGYAAGIIGQTNNDGTVIDGCENHGAILSDIINGTNKYIATIVANTNRKAIIISNNKIGGKIGPYTGGEAAATEITAQNFEEYIYSKLATAVEVPTLENNTFAGSELPAAGIATLADLLAFRDAVNAGGSTAEWENEGVVTLLGDIDMSSVTEWTPIGNASCVGASAYTLSQLTGNAFTGIFDGAGHSLKNFTMSYSGGEANSMYGLFGAIDGGTVRNLTIGAPSGDNSSFTVTASGGVAETGVIAGGVRNGTVSNCTNYAKIIYNGTSAQRIDIAMIGMLYSNGGVSKLEELENRGDITIETNGNSTNGAGTAIHAAGICGFANGTSGFVNSIAYCSNYGDITSNAARTAGIVAAANSYTALNSCVNNGDHTNSCGDTGRSGNITCILGAGGSMVDCINNGDLISTSTAGARVGGLLSLVNSPTNTFSGCANYGEIISNSANRGAFFGYSSQAASGDNHVRWENCVVGGKVGVYNGGTYLYDEYGEDQKQKYIGPRSGTDASTFDGITYMIGTGGGDEEDPATLRILFIGNSFTKDAVEHLPGMVKAAGIETLKMTHLYFGGRTIPEYRAGYASASDYTCYKYAPGSSQWLSYTGYNIKQTVESDKWDIVCIQEHTGNKAAWVWDATEKQAIEGLISSIKADQDGHTPRFVYIMSQAYFDMGKIGSGSKPAMTFTTQDEMFGVITTQAQKVLAETDVEMIIPTGTALQNLRTSSLNTDLDLTRDGYHMDYGLARYAAACVVFESLVSPSFGGVTLDGNTWRYNTTGEGTTPVTDANQPVALSAARYALQTPFAVTDMSVETDTPDNGVEDIDYEEDPNKE